MPANPLAASPPRHESTNMPDTIFHYFGTDNPVTLGDRVLVRSWFGRAWLATVVHVPGQSEPDAELGDDSWAYKTDNGSIYAGVFAPRETPHPGRQFEFVSRPGAEAQEVIRAFRMPLEEPQGQPGRDFLALLGCGAIVVVVVFAGIDVWYGLFGRR